MHALFVLSVWLHILAAAVWIGGMVFLALVLVPLLRRSPDRRQASVMLQAAGRRLRVVGWAALGVLIATGVFNFGYRAGWDDILAPSRWREAFGTAFEWKLGLVALTLVMSVLHDTVIGPRATALGRVDPTSREAVRARLAASWIGRVTMLLSVVMVFLSVVMLRGWP